MSQSSSLMDSFQKLVDKVNERYGGVGSIIGVTFWVILYIYSLRAILEGIFGH
jgi:hypothetical protein